MEVQWSAEPHYITAIWWVRSMFRKKEDTDRQEHILLSLHCLKVSTDKVKQPKINNEINKRSLLPRMAIFQSSWRWFSIWNLCWGLCRTRYAIAVSVTLTVKKLSLLSQVFCTFQQFKMVKHKKAVETVNSSQWYLYAFTAKLLILIFHTHTQHKHTQTHTHTHRYRMITITLHVVRQ